MRNPQGIIWSVVSFLLAVVLIYFVVKGALFVGWAFGGVLGFILALCIIFEVLSMSGFLWGVFIILVLCALLQAIF